MSEHIKYMVTGFEQLSSYVVVKLIYINIRGIYALMSKILSKPVASIQILAAKVKKRTENRMFKII